MADPLNELRVVGESREEALERAEANLQLLAALALKAFIDGGDAREIAHACGYDVDGKKRPGVTVSDEAPTYVQTAFGTFDMSDFAPWLTGRAASTSSGAEKFVEWLTGELARRLREALADG